MEEIERIGSTVTVTRGQGVATVRLERGDRLNALSLAALRDLKAAADALRSDTGVHAIVVAGVPAFTAGADLKDPEMRARDGAALLERRELLRAGPDMCDAWAALDQPTIAAIEGFCIGGGVSLAVSCDWRVIAADAHLRLPEIPLGMNMSWHTLPRLVALMGPAAAKRFVILGEKLSAEAALAQGLVDEVAAPGGAVATAQILAMRAASMPPVAARVTKRAISEAAEALARTATYADLDQFALLSGDPAYREAIAAFRKEGG